MPEIIQSRRSLSRADYDATAVKLTGNQTVAGTKTLTGPLDHDGTTVGLNGNTPVAKAAAIAAPTAPGAAYVQAEAASAVAAINAIRTALANIGITL